MNNNSSDKYLKIVSELISTEGAYLEHLDLILKCFVDPLLCSRLIPSKDVTTIFGDIRSIRLLNQVLHDHLKLVDVSGAFSQLIHFLKLYSAYARNFPSSQTLLTKLINTNSEFSRFVERQECLPTMRGLKLPALLIMPIQRVPRYKLLLEQLFNSSDRESQTRSELFAILQQVNEVAEQINNCVDEFDNCNQIITLQRSLDRFTPKLLIPGRKLLKSGQLVKIKCKNESLVLLAAEYRILDDWVNAIETAIKSLLENRRTLRKESSSSNPLRRSFLKANKMRQNSSLTEKFRLQHVQLKQANKNNNSNRNPTWRFITAVRKRVLKITRNRPVATSSPKRSSSPVCKKRRIIARSPILSVVEEEEMKRISAFSNRVNDFVDSPLLNHTENLKRRPWWDEEAKNTLESSNKKSRCCF